MTATCDVSVYEVKEANIEPLDPSRPSSTSQAGIMDEKSQDIIESTVDNILSEIAEGREIASDVLDETTRTAVLQAMNEGKAIQLTANAEVLGEEEIDAADLRIIQEYLSNITDAQHSALQYFDFSFHLVSDDGALLGEIKQLKMCIRDRREDAYAHVQKLNSYLRKALSAMEDIVINSPEEGSPFILNISNLRIGSEIMLNALNAKGFAVSAQSTCSSHSKAAVSYTHLDVYKRQVTYL